MSQFLKNSKRLIPGALISIALIAALLYFIDFGTLWNAVRNANYAILAKSGASSMICSGVMSCKFSASMIRVLSSVVETGMD